MADQNEQLGLSRKDIFDDGANTGKNPISNSGVAHEWPEHMREHFKQQHEMNSFMDQRITAGIEKEHEE